ncbi:MAG: hypothetical protein AABX88_03210 [Nanoarchaeota archaeon]
MHKNNLLTRDEYNHCRSRLNGYILQNTINIHEGEDCKKCPVYYRCDVVYNMASLRFGDLYFPKTKKSELLRRCDAHATDLDEIDNLERENFELYKIYEKD